MMNKRWALALVWTAAFSGSSMACTTEPTEPTQPTNSSVCLSRNADLIKSPTVVSGAHNVVYAYNGVSLDFRSKPLAANDPIYPLRVDRADEGTCITGLKVAGRQSSGLTWQQMKNVYDGDALIIKYATGMKVTVENSWLKNVEDGFSPRALSASSQWILRSSYMTAIRDDAIENDQCLPGLIDDVLIDGAHMFISTRPGKDGVCAKRNTVVVRNSLVRLTCQPDDRSNGSCASATSHGQLFKWDSSAGPVDVRDTIFLVPSVAHSGPSAMAFPPGVYSNVTLIWLGGGSYPGKLPASGVKVISDKSVWDTARANWLAKHGCTSDGSTCAFLVR
jgi:hypothetical protein